MKTEKTVKQEVPSEHEKTPETNEGTNTAHETGNDGKLLDVTYAISSIANDLDDDEDLLLDLARLKKHVQRAKEEAEQKRTVDSGSIMINHPSRTMISMKLKSNKSVHQNVTPTKDNKMASADEKNELDDNNEDFTERLRLNECPTPVEPTKSGSHAHDHEHRSRRSSRDRSHSKSRRSRRSSLSPDSRSYRRRRSYKGSSSSSTRKSPSLSPPPSKRSRHRRQRSNSPPSSSHRRRSSPSSNNYHDSSTLFRGPRTPPNTPPADNNEFSHLHDMSMTMSPSNWNIDLNQPPVMKEIHKVYDSYDYNGSMSSSNAVPYRPHPMQSPSPSVHNVPYGENFENYSHQRPKAQIHGPHHHNQPPPMLYRQPNSHQQMSSMIQTPPPRNMHPFYQSPATAQYGPNVMPPQPKPRIPVYGQHGSDDYYQSHNVPQQFASSHSNLIEIPVQTVAVQKGNVLEIVPTETNNENTNSCSNNNYTNNSKNHNSNQNSNNTINSNNITINNNSDNKNDNKNTDGDKSVEQIDPQRQTVMHQQQLRLKRKIERQQKRLAKEKRKEFLMAEIKRLNDQMLVGSNGKIVRAGDLFANPSWREEILNANHAGVTKMSENHCERSSPIVREPIKYEYDVDLKPIKSILSEQNRTRSNEQEPETK